MRRIDAAGRRVERWHKFGLRLDELGLTLPCGHPSALRGDGCIKHDGGYRCRMCSGHMRWRLQPVEEE